MDISLTTFKHETRQQQPTFSLSPPQRNKTTSLSIVGHVLGRRGRLVLADKLGLLQHVELILLGVKTAEAEPESGTADESNDSDGGVVPDEEGILGKGKEGLTDGGGEGAHEEVDGHDNGLHVGGGLGEGVLERGDVGEDLGETDQDVGETLGPDVDGGRAAATLLAGVNVLAAVGVHLVNVVLHDGGGDHGGGGDEEAKCHAADGGEGEADLAETGVEEVVDDGDHDDNGDGVEVLDNVVGDAVTLHGRGLDGQVAGHLVVGEEEDGQEEEDLAGLETTADLIDPLVVVGEPGGALADGHVGGLAELKVGLEEGALLLGEAEHLHELFEDGAGRGAEPVVLLLGPEDDGGDEEEGRGDEEGLPEALKVLDVDHANLARHGADVDAKVKVEEDAGVGHGRVDNDALARLEHLDAHAVILVLLGEERGDVGLEESGTDAECDETNDEGSEAGISLDNNLGRRGGDENDVGNGGDTNGQVESPETTHASIGNPGTVSVVSLLLSPLLPSICFKWGGVGGEKRGVGIV